LKQTVQLGALSAANIGISFLFNWHVLTQLGAGMETDALFAGMTVPQLVTAVISGTLMQVLVPILAVKDATRIQLEAWNLLFLVGGLFGVVCILFWLSAPWWIPLIVPGFDEAGKALTVELTRIQLIGMVFVAINGVQWAACHARQQYLWAELASISANAFALLLLILALPRFGVIVVACISALRMVVQTLLLAPSMGKLVAWPNLRSAVISIAWQRIKFLLVGTTYYMTDPVVDRFLLSTTSSGTLSLYYFVQQIYGAVSELINKSIAIPLIPVLSKLREEKNRDILLHTYNQKLWQVAVLSLLGLLIIVVLGQDLLSIFVRYGRLSSQNLELLWFAMVLMLGRFVFGNIGMIMTSMLYSLGDTKKLTENGVLAYTFGMAIKIILFYFFGILGLALGVTIHYMIHMILMWNNTREKYL